MSSTSGTSRTRASTGAPTDGRVLRGERTRASILDCAVDLASVEGLERLSIGRLATELGVSKSGLFAHFGSKESLQLATVAAAVDRYVDSVVRPVLAAPAGRARLELLCDRWLEYSRSRVFPGGCFFYGTSAEFDARPGAVRDALAAAQLEWTQFLVRLIEQTRRLGGLDPQADAEQLAFELRALLEAANQLSVLHDDDTGYERARAAITARLRGPASTPHVAPDRAPGPSTSDVT